MYDFIGINPKSIGSEQLQKPNSVVLEGGIYFCIAIAISLSYDRMSITRCL